MVRLSGKKFKKIALYAVIIAAIFLPGTVKYCGLSIQKSQNESKLRSLTQENRRLREENKKLKEDPVYIEKMARENLGLAKKGEVVVKFKNQTTTDKIQ